MSPTSPFDGETRLYVMTPIGWEYIYRGAAYAPKSIPREVQALYIAEGWTRIFYHELFGAPTLVYPQIEGRPA